MLKHTRILSIIFALFFSKTIIVNATELIKPQQMTYENLSKTFAIQLDNHKQISKEYKRNSLKFIKETIDNNQTRHIRLQQYYLGVPILEGYAIAHIKNQNIKHQHKITGSIYEDLPKDLGLNIPFSKFLTNDVLENFKNSYAKDSIVNQNISPIIYIDKNFIAHWAYLVELEIANKHSLPKKPKAIVDVYTKKQLAKWNNIQTTRTLVKGLGFGGNHKSGLVQYGKDLPFLNISYDDFTGICYMENKEIKIVDMQNHYTGDNLTIISNCPYSKQDNAYWTGYNEDGYDKINGAYSTSNDALYIANIIKNMYQEVYKVEPLVYKGQPQKLIMRVHYGKNYANAFWDGKQMSFGDGDYSFYPLVSLSIGAHEISHGFTEQNSNLVYFGQSGAINESFSDMAAQAAEYYVNQQNSWQIGHEVIKNSSGIRAIRFMDNPSLDKHSIEFAHHYRDDMDVHYASGVYNKLFYLIATTPNWNTEKAFKVMLKANMDYWIPTATFNTAACGVISAAEDLKYSTEDIKNALDEVIIDYDNCN